ncbi:TetR/AcrR family transcriptional regulator [uncultured Ferrimonas sp.]|uniref:TetR/AcrR family transcriptional regulator n=1 Tax=uncultured Ferrimonas sp. TaxID=432640 RepID=UPI002626F44A|nr:TetR/AcrR family transcriptional regulator [uncultured Ferrimonas sp.]
MTKSSASKASYHHGDLRQTLLDAATAMIAEAGIDGLSLRKLAERVGVSRTAPYHHFKDKGQLLSAIATEGFRSRTEQAQALLADQSLTAKQRFSAFFRNYIAFATESPQMYELMFGHTIWRHQQETDELKQVAYPCFQQQVAMTKLWQQQGLLPLDQDPLRLAQVTWGTMHGIARLVIDGVYANNSHIGEMIDCAVALFVREPAAEAERH